MENIIVYVDDANFARQALHAQLAAGTRVRWVLVACAPRMTRRISKWVSHTARENWRAKWADRLYHDLVPGLYARGDEVVAVLARGPLPELTDALLEEHGRATRVIDARRPKFDSETAPDPADGQPRWMLPGPLAGIGFALLLMGD